MTNDNFKAQPVAVIGAGPAGLYAARKLASAGMPVALINRDVKPGGLAEYGIFHNKYRMKLGLRRQFHRIMEIPEIHYFGNITVGQDGDLDLQTLKNLGFKAIMVTVGAQGTKWLGLPGEELTGVYHAKDIVYHYNALPPFSTQQFQIGDKVLLIGAGNVMVDIANYCVHDIKAKEVTAIVRRGPADVKFDKKEMETIARNLDLNAFDAEIERTAPVLEAVGQDPLAAKAFILSALLQGKEKDSDTVFGFRFLATPKTIVGDDDGNVTGLEIEHTTLKLRDSGTTSAVRLGTTEVIEADTVIFCIGDRVSAKFGLPLDRWQEYAKNPNPQFPLDGISFEAYNEAKQTPVEGVFLAGWAREASSGLVGTAKKDGEKGASAMLEYLDTIPQDPNPTQPIENLESYLVGVPGPVVRKVDYLRLAEIEEARAEELGVEMYKFTTNEEMFAAMGLAVIG
jgi:ferredoxin--NADP+ reductase